MTFWIPWEFSNPMADRKRVQQNRTFQPVHLVYLLDMLKFISPFLLQNPVYEPHRDEFLYLAEGHQLAWGYLEASLLKHKRLFIAIVHSL